MLEFPNEKDPLTERIIGCSIEVHLDLVVEAQVLTYLRLTGLRRGLLLNFNSRLLKDGIRPTSSKTLRL